MSNHLMGQHHQHHHGHAHHHQGPHLHHGAGGRLGIAFALNLSFAFIELIGGYLTNSMAVMSDALHDFGDALALGLALYFEKKSHQKSDGRYSYGYRRLSILAALLTGLILFIGSIAVLYESIPRLLNPQEPHALGMMGLALLGLAVNGFAAWKLSAGHSLNEKMVMLHLLEDVAGWVLVLIGALLIHFYQWSFLDPFLAIVLAVWICFNVFKNLKQVVRIFLQAVPDSFDLEHMMVHLKKIPGFVGLHHVHLWSLDGQSHILTAHLILRQGLSVREEVEVKKMVKQELLHHGVLESTLEIERENDPCDDPEHKH